MTKRLKSHPRHKRKSKTRRKESRRGPRCHLGQEKKHPRHGPNAVDGLSKEVSFREGYPHKKIDAGVDTTHQEEREDTGRGHKEETKAPSGPSAKRLAPADEVAHTSFDVVENGARSCHLLLPCGHNL